ncbi:Lipase 1 [Melipona quadrifasciata]|uniref:Lipase 1 n=1 Tax=Melipona quadrifasciata TaxID=166423 RepID=A0A0M8ZPX4_9HYME|nr:Lipase 1 [Melipona quadrifasciata]
MPLLLLHGLLDCSITWPATDLEVGLGYILVDQGYDVWLGNMRGNKYSQKHLNLTTSNPEFWMLSWHEIGIYDLPTMIDRIIEQTKQDLYGNT